MDKIKNCENATPFRSDIFCVNHFKFYIDIWPNGYSSNQIGVANLYLNLVSLSQKISEIQFKFTISLKEKNLIWTSHASLSMMDTSIGWRDTQLTTQDLQDLDSLTLEFRMDTIINIIDNEGNNLLDKYAEYQESVLSLCISDYKWYINDKHLISRMIDWKPNNDDDNNDDIDNNNNKYNSPYFKMHGISWYLQLRPKQITDDDKANNSTSLFLNVVAIPANIANVWIFVSLSLKETGTTYSDILQFENDLASIGWPNDPLPSKDIDKLNTLSFKVEMLLIDVYDSLGKPVTNKYLNIDQYDNDNDNNNNNNILLLDQYKESIEIHRNIISSLWQLPSIRSSEISLLIAGYLRINNINNMIINEILTVCIEYFGVDIDVNMMDICNAECGTVFNSNIFDIGYMKWSMVLYPNGNKEGTKGFVNWFIHLLSMSPKIAKISFNYKIFLAETYTMSERTTIFTYDHRSEGWRGLLKTERLKDLNKLMFTLDLKIFDVYSVDGSIIKENELKTKYYDPNNYMYYKDDYEWKITDFETIDKIKNANIGDEICSNFFRLHSFIWYLEIYPMGISDTGNNRHCEFYLTLASLPPNISSIAFQYELSLKETYTKFESFTQFDNKGMSEGWPAILLNDTLKSIDNIYTFKVIISLIDIYDIDGKNITNKYINKHIINGIERSLQFKSETYIWKINDIEKIKNASTGSDGYKQMFTMHGFLWFMEIYPNGNNPESKGSFKWYINMISLSPKIDRITFYYDVLLEETGTKRKSSTWFDHNSYSDGWINSYLKTDDIKDLNSITFKFEMILFNVYDTDGDIMLIEDYLPFQPKPIITKPVSYGEFIWETINDDEVRCMKEAEKGRYFESKIFEMHQSKWFLRAYPASGDDDNVCDLFLRLLTLPTNVGAICIKYELYNIETNAKYSTFTQFDHDDDSEGWPRYKLSTKQLQDLSSIKFKVIISIIDVYDKQTGFAITDKFIDDMDDCKQSKIQTFPEEHYQWRILGENLNMIKNSKNGEIIQSPIFIMGNLKWMQELYPNGANSSSEGFCGWYLNVIAFPSNVSKIIFQFKVILYNDDNDNKALVRAGRTYSVSFDDSTVWWGSKRIELKKLNQSNILIFDLEITVLEIFDNDGNKMDKIFDLNDLNDLKMESINKTLTMIGDYIWKIKNNTNILSEIHNANNGEYFESDLFKLFGFEWKLRIYPNGIEKTQKGEAKLQLHLKELPISIKSISLQFQFEIKETGTIYFNFANFRDNHLSKGWRTSYLKTMQLKNINELTIKVIITVIDIFDDKGNIIPFKNDDNNKITKKHSITRYVAYSK